MEFATVSEIFPRLTFVAQAAGDRDRVWPANHIGKDTKREDRVFPLLRGVCTSPVDRSGSDGRAGRFDALRISDHYHPWNDAQGQSSFVWSIIGAIGQTCRLPVTTAVTCPTVRIHPAIVAQAAATSNVLLESL